MKPILHYDLAEIKQSVAARVQAQVERNPASLAVVDEKHALTYEELNSRANRVAHAILAARGHPSPEPIAILLEHGSAAVIAILGILKAGKFYVPLDLTLPGTRLDAILQDSEAPLLVTNALNRARARELVGGGIQLLDMDTVGTEVAHTNPNLTIPSDTLLNLMYTSGTTGQAKGVIQTQCNLLHAIATTNFPPHLSTEHVAQLTPFSFGGSAAMLFRTLLFGAALYPFNLKQAGLPRLAPFLESHAITRFHTVPTVLRNWLELLPPGQSFPCLRVVEVGGEPLFKHDLERLFPHVSKTCVVRNALGTTESYIATWSFIDATSKVEDGVVPVGFPAPDMDALILDEAGQPCQPGETGEIHIKSRYLSPGYWGKPELSRATFIPDAQENGAILWKTGDLGRLRGDGELEHLGRKDGMVKIRGHQVVLTFVESAVRALDGIRDAAVIALPNAAGDLRLVAYLVASVPPPSSRSLREALNHALPEYMVPSTFVLLAQLPKLPNGKLDRRNLPAPDDMRPELETTFVAPRTPLEAQLARIWREVLGVEQIGVHDAFVELGGNSLQAAQVVSRASMATGVEIPLSAVFDVPTIEGLAQLIAQRLAERVQSEELERMLREVEALN